MYFSAAHNVVVYEVAHPEQVVAAIAGARPLNGHAVAVPATLWNLQVARILGLPVPSYLDAAYDWPGQFTPYAHQRHMANFHALHPRSFNLSSMGTGKTLAALWAADFLMRQGAVHRALIISPLSTLRRVWEDEIFRHFLGRRKAVILHGERRKRQELLKDTRFDFYIINHDGLGIGSLRAYGRSGLYLGPIAAEIEKREDIDLVIVDEASAYKDGAAFRTKILRTVLANKPYVWLLSGTPTPNAPTDAHSLARLVHPDQVENYQSFKMRTMAQLSQYKWAPKPGAQEAVAKILSPGIRYSLEECVDLPPLVVETRDVPLSATQAAAYQTLKKDLALTVKSGKTITAVNEAVLRMKLIQIACIGAGTRVLTSTRGWVPIETVRCGERVWDGKDFVGQKGAIPRGEKQVILTGSALTTPDHRLLTSDGWREAVGCRAESSNRPYWPRVRLPHGVEACRYDYTIDATGNVVVSMRLRQRGSAGKSELTHQTSGQLEALRVSSWGAPHNARHEQDTAVSYLDSYAAAVSRPNLQGLSKLRGARDHGLRALARFFRDVLGGHAGGLSASLNDRADGQRRRLRARELPLGDSEGATRKSAPKKRMVYDLIDCGPRRRFVICGPDGDLYIAHNCGAVYGPDREVHRTDCGPRLAELVEVIREANSKVIVFAPLTSVVQLVHSELRAEFGEKAVARVYGATTQTQRSEIFRAFQQETLPRIIVADPGTMSHGLTLTAAATIVWFGPCERPEIYEQANARIRRPGQVKSMLVVRLTSTPIERMIFARLHEKQTLQGAILKIVEEGR